MTPIDFFSQPLVALATMLLIASPLPEDEKEALLTALPRFSEDDLAALVENLQQEIADTRILEDATRNLVQSEVTSEA